MTKREQNTNEKIANQGRRITELKEQLTYYREITETLREPFIILNQDLVVVTANLAFYRTFKVKKRDTEGKRIYNLGNNQWDAPELRELLEDILPTHRIFNNYAVTHDFQSLGIKTILLNARQVDGKELILLAMEDVTARWKLKNDSAELTKNLIKQRDELQKLNDAKDEFISLASHQLRTPATVVKQYLGMLDLGFAGKLTQGQLQMLKVANTNNERQLEIIEHLLRVARVDAGKVYLHKILCDIETQVKIAVDGQAVLFEKRGQNVVFNKPKTQMIANIDPKLMLMVIENVLDNAGKYSDDGQSVIVDIHQNETHTIISVKDHGVGIRKTDQDKLFKKFSRIDNPLSISVVGTGLGLYWAKKVLDLHHGRLKVTSTLKSGSTFEIITPTTDDFSRNQ